MDADVEHQLTEDGSSTLFSTQFQAHYHSTHGAINESNHVFIKCGLEHIINSYPSLAPIRILEFGLGTGLNALLTAQYARDHAVSIYYESMEAYPVSIELISQLNYADTPADTQLLTDIHEAHWGQTATISPSFDLRKREIKFEDFLPDGLFHLIYFDAFAPTTQAHLWEETIMKKCYESLAPNGALVTFCAKGSFKRALRAVGFTVERLPGPPGKREMTRAAKLL